MIRTETITIRGARGETFSAYVAAPKDKKSPALILLHEIFGINKAMRDTATRFAEEGYLVIVPDLFWRTASGVDLGYGEKDVAKAYDLYGAFDKAAAMDDIFATAAAARQRPDCGGAVGVLGFCLGGTLAVMAAAQRGIDVAVAFYPVALQDVTLTGAFQCPVMMHFGGNDPLAPPDVLKTLRGRFGATARIYEYLGAGHAFFNAERVEYVHTAAKLAHTRSLEVLRKAIGPEYDLEALWERHLQLEFAEKDADLTIETMVETPYVNHVPTMTGGIGRDELRHFYRHFFVNVHPDDVNVTLVSRTVGVDRVVDEMVSSFTHDRMIDYLLPGVAPTGRKVVIPMVAIVSFRGDKICHEHIHYDMASLLAQVGVLDTKTLPITGAEQGLKVLDEHSAPSNHLMATWDRPIAASVKKRA